MRRAAKIRRKPGDHIRFRVAPWFFKDQTVFKGTIIDIAIDDDGDTYYHVNAWLDKEHHVKDGIIYEREVVKDDEGFVKKRWYGCHCIVCPPPPRKLRKCWMRKRYRAHRRELLAIEKRFKALRGES